MTDTVKSWIEERRATREAAKEYPAVVPQSPTWMNALKAHGEYELDAKANFPRALDALNAVLELHVPVETGVGDQYWKEPDYCPTCREYWPCETAQAIEGAIND